MKAFHALKKIYSDSRFHLSLLSLALILYKFYLLEVNSRAIFDCHWCLTPKAIIYEFQFIFLLLALHLWAALTRWPLLQIFLRLAVIAVLIIMAVDLIVLQHFLVRFTLHELIKFIDEFSAITAFLRQLVSNPWIAALTAVTLAITLLIFSRYLKPGQFNARSPLLLACMGFGIVGVDFLKPIEFHTPYLQNSVNAFFSIQTRNQPYSEAFAKNISANSIEEQHCHEGKGARPDLILLVVESLSMYHSSLFSGIRNWMPQFDNASQKGRRLSNFYANGVNTEQGLISMLVGEPPIAKGLGNKTIDLFEQFRDPGQSVPGMLKGFGYHTFFLTTGNLGFLGKGDWLRNIGFHSIEGHEASFYQGMKRFHFDAAPDDALYNRALQKLRAHKKKNTTPIFMTLETVTTHHPYIDPESGKQSEELTFRYADRQLGVFIKQLMSFGFFNNGYLMIVSDHRAMVPATHDEINRYSDRAYARIPFSIIGPGINSDEEELNQFSQSDLLPSLRHWLGNGFQCFRSNQGIFLPTAEHPPACIFTHRSYSPDNVFIHCGEDDHIIKLHGDRTGYVGSRTPSNDLLAVVNRLRLGKL